MKSAIIIGQLLSALIAPLKLLFFSQAAVSMKKKANESKMLFKLIKYQTATSEFIWNRIPLKARTSAKRLHIPILN